MLLLSITIATVALVFPIMHDLWPYATSRHLKPPTVSADPRLMT